MIPLGLAGKVKLWPGAALSAWRNDFRFSFAHRQEAAIGGWEGLWAASDPDRKLPSIKYRSLPVAEAVCLIGWRNTTNLQKSCIQRRSDMHDKPASSRAAWLTGTVSTS